ELVVVVVAPEDRDHTLGAPQHDASEAREGEGAVLRDRGPRPAGREPRPAPLAGGAVQVAEHQVDETVLEVRLGHDVLRRIAIQPLEELRCLDDLERAEAAGSPRPRRGPPPGRAIGAAPIGAAGNAAAVWSRYDDRMPGT